MDTIRWTGTRYSRREFVSALAVSPLMLRRAVANASEKTFRGMFPIMATPYTHSKEVDYEDLAREVDFLDRCGVPGMAWPQLFGETFKLSVEERKRGMEVIVKAAKGRKPAIVLGVDGPNLAVARAYLEHAESLNPDALIALPPREAKSSEDILQYYRSLAQLTTRPFFIQNASIIEGGPKLEVKDLVELSRQFPHCGYYKEEVSPTIERMLALSKERPSVRRVFGGEAGRNLMYLMRLGLDGCMAGNAYADVFVQIWDLFSSGKKAESQERYSKLLLLLNCESYLPGTRQYIMKKRGVFKTMVSRMSEFALSREATQEIDFHFDALKPYLRA